MSCTSASTFVRKNSSRASVESLKYVTAHIQSGVVEKILPLLTEEEEDAYRRGRNLGHSSTPKSSTVGEYRRATGLEALFGWLYLSGKHDRLRELFDTAFAEEKRINKYRTDGDHASSVLLFKF